MVTSNCFKWAFITLGPPFHHVFHDLVLIVGFSFPGFNFDGPLGAGADTSTQAIAEKVTNKVGLSINYLQSTLRTSRDAVPTAGALFLVNFDNISLHNLHLPQL